LPTFGEKPGERRRSLEQVALEPRGRFT